MHPLVGLRRAALAACAPTGTSCCSSLVAGPGDTAVRSVCWGSASSVGGFLQLGGSPIQDSDTVLFAAPVTVDVASRVCVRTRASRLLQLWSCSSATGTSLPQPRNGVVMEPRTLVIPDAASTERGWRAWGGDQVPSTGVDGDEEPRSLRPLGLAPRQKGGPGLWVVKLSDPLLTKVTWISECVAKHNMWLINCLKAPEEDGDYNTCFLSRWGASCVSRETLQVVFSHRICKLAKTYI